MGRHRARVRRHRARPRRAVRRDGARRSASRRPWPQHPSARALFVTQSETSTGVLEDVEAYAALTPADRDPVRRGHRLVARRGAVPDGRLGHRRGGRRLAEGADVPAGARVRRAERPRLARGRAGHAAPASTGTFPPSAAGRRRTRGSSRRPCRSSPGWTSRSGSSGPRACPEVYRRHDRLARAARARGGGARPRASSPGRPRARPSPRSSRRRRRRRGGRARCTARSTT